MTLASHLSWHVIPALMDLGLCYHTNLAKWTPYCFCFSLIISTSWEKSLTNWQRGTSHCVWSKILSSIFVWLFTIKSDHKPLQYLLGEKKMMATTLGTNPHSVLTTTRFSMYQAKTMPMLMYLADFLFQSILQKSNARGNSVSTWELGDFVSKYQCSDKPWSNTIYYSKICQAWLAKITGTWTPPLLIKGNWNWAFKMVAYCGEVA